MNDSETRISLPVVTETETVVTATLIAEPAGFSLLQLLHADDVRLLVTLAIRGLEVEATFAKSEDAKRQLSFLVARVDKLNTPE